VVLLIAKEQDVLYEGCDILISRINSDKLKNTTMHTPYQINVKSISHKYYTIYYIIYLYIFEREKIFEGAENEKYCKIYRHTKCNTRNILIFQFIQSKREAFHKYIHKILYFRPVYSIDGFGYGFPGLYKLFIAGFLLFDTFYIRRQFVGSLYYGPFFAFIVEKIFS